MKSSDFLSDKKLIVFDIDDTLFRTTAEIKVIKNGKIVRSLDTQQYNQYKLAPDEEYDFSEFTSSEKFHRDSEPINPMIDKLKKFISDSNNKVIILTARSDFDDKDKFLDTFTKHGIDMSRVHVHRAGNLSIPDTPAKRKAVFIRRYLDTGKYNHVTMYDDSFDNLKVFSELEAEYPDVKFFPYMVNHSGKISLVREEINQFHNKNNVVEAEKGTAAAKEIYKTFRSMGYKKLGSGAEATVWAKDDDNVIKVIMPEDTSSMDSASETFYKFYEFCRQNKDQPNLPKFVDIIKDKHHATFTADDREFIMIGMERLKPIPEGSLSQALIWQMSDLVTKKLKWNQAYKEMIKKESWKHWDEQPPASKIIRYLKNIDDVTYAKFDVLYTLMLLLYLKGNINKMGWDLHTENVMQRSDETLVITDPWFNNQLEKK